MNQISACVTRSSLIHATNISLKDFPQPIVKLVKML